MNKRYFAARCNNCGRWNSTFTENIHAHSFKCFNCLKSTRLKLTRYYGFNCNAHETNDLTQSANLVRKLNSQVGGDSQLMPISDNEPPTFFSYKKIEDNLLDTALKTLEENDG